MRFILFLLLISMVPSTLAKTEILRHLKMISRDHYYIHIDDVDIPYQTEGIVGGEHENVYRILGFRGDTFIIVMQSPDDSMGYRVSGQGFQHVKGTNGDVVTIDWENTWVDISAYAHPNTAEYKLTVKKHELID